MKKVLSMVLALCLLLSVTAAASGELVNPFVDVKQDAWYHDEIVKAVSTGIINGKSATEFKPEDLLTYAEAIKLAACMNQVYLNGEVTLKPGDPWYQPYVDFCEENKIIQKKYNFDENVTRAGYMEIFANALPDEAFSEINDIPDGSILDVKGNAPYTLYVYKLYRAGIVTGVDEIHNCDPDENIKRCEVAAIISRMMDEEKRVEFEMPKSEEKLENKGTIDDDPINENPTTENEIKPEVEPTDKPDDDPIISNPDIPIEGNESEVIVIQPEKPDKPEIDAPPILVLPFEIVEQPQSYEAEEYGETKEFEVKVDGGKAPYTFQWYARGFRDSNKELEFNEYVKLRGETGDLVTDVCTSALIITIDKENTILGSQIYCEVTDSEGTTLKSDSFTVYGPFSMPINLDSIIVPNKEYELAGRVADGIIRKGDKISVERNGKIIATGVATDLKMFDKSIDEGKKGDNLGIVFEIEKGVKPQSGDIVIKYKDFHVIDTSDIIN